ncbi:6-hydroxymethylpterin diphosphokinase MptE-like protein [Candidatus Nitronereus thalassa]|uniref:DUF115 domain-containing protein n=1 Tax=Candidatus Nitronereus thalassa TaxID=3020898 RepID=A0ABU3KA42_9BACT|nr:6-hydroxymethylpterin diphosphokinase MptE-like protein [Candidatus Nitronereus thalassa]MDT7043266.1 DUF115 domain-containing protein [Candidatus Nitronereus thalassa]
MTIYEKNVEALKTYHPELVVLTTQTISTDHIQVDLTGTGTPRLVVRNASGDIVELHDPQDPLSVAEGTVEQMAHSLQGVTVSLGLELGYFALAVVRRLDTLSRLIVYEADPAIFLTALREVDLTEILTSSRVKLVVGREGKLRHWCTKFVEQTNGTLRVISYEPAFRLDPDAYGETAEQELERIPSIVKAARNALVRRGPMFIDSVLQNTPEILLAGGVSTLKNRFPGMPAILVAAGPSLEKNVHQLRGAKGRAVIIAADTALGYLLLRGIVPDFVVSVDPQKETFRKFQGVEIPDEVALVFHPAVSPHIPKHFPGPKFTLDAAMPVYQWLQEYWAPKGAIDTECMCQVHVGFNLAQWMGCETIILAGQDYCYSDEGMHVKNGGYLNVEEDAANVANGQPAQDIFGKPVKTNPTFLNYKAILEKKIRQFSGKVVHATEGGLSLEGAELYLLGDAVAEFCQSPSISVANQLSETCGQSSGIDWMPFLHELRTRSRDVFRVQRTSHHVSVLLTKMKERWQRVQIPDKEFQQLGKKVERLTALIPRYTRVRELLHWMNIELERQLAEDTQTLETLTDPKDKHALQIERGLRYYGGLSKTAPPLGEKLKEFLCRMEQWRELDMRLPQPEGSSTWLDIAEGFMRLHMYDKASQCLASYAQKKSEARLGLTEAVLSIRLYLELFQFSQAVEQAEKAREVFPDNPEVKSLWSHAKWEYRQWLGKVKAALAEAPITVDTHLKAGDFYHRIGDYVRAKQHYRLAVEEERRLPIPDDAWDFFSKKDREQSVGEEDQTTVAGS